MKNILYIFSVIILLNSCGSGEVEAISDEERAEVLSQKNYSPIIIERKGIKLIEASDFPLFSDITLNLNSTNQRIKKGINVLEFDISGFNLGQETTDQTSKNYPAGPFGQHLAIQNINGREQSYSSPKASYDFKSGDNVLLAHLNRSYNMSLKNPNSFLFFNVNINQTGSSISTALTDTALFYLQPKGTFIDSQSDKLLLDFYINNVTLSEKGNYLSVTIDKQEFKIYRWKPYWIYGLGVGLHKFKIGLRNKQGEPIKGKYLRDIEETVSIKEISILEN